jgi:fructose-1,6-bisphosphatase/inositol monophosphatase family enzyme
MVVLFYQINEYTKKKVEKLIISMEGEKALRNSVNHYFDAGFSHRSFQVFRCAVFSLSHLASGSIHIYFNSLLNLWDCAAGDIIVREAGGLSCRDMSLNPIFPDLLYHYLNLDFEDQKLFRLNLVVSSNKEMLNIFADKVIKPMKS